MRDTTITPFQTRTIDALSSQKVTLGANFLTVDGSMTDSELNDLFRSLSFVQGSTLFWVGDCLNIAHERKGEAYARAVAATDYCAQTLYNAKHVCKSFPIDQRLSLSFSHHEQALAECKGDATKARKFLKQAQENNLSVSEMRKTIRLALADAPKPEPSVVTPDVSFLGVMDAILVIKRFLNNITSTTLEMKRGYLRAELDELCKLAATKLG